MQSHQQKIDGNKKYIQKRPISTAAKKSRVSNVIFKRELSHSQIQKILQKVKKFYKQKQWRFYFKQSLKKQDPTQLFKASETILIEELIFHFCDNQKILKSLTCINFSRLRYLALPGNKISNWELLSTVDLAQLEIVDLRQNYQSNCKPLIKCNFNQVNLFTLPQILVDGSQQLLKRSVFTQSVNRMFINFANQTNIYPFVYSLIFKEKNWVDDFSAQININGPLISTYNQKLAKRFISKRSNLDQYPNKPLGLNDNINIL